MPETILVGVDGSQASLDALRWAEMFGRRCDWKVRAFMACDEVTETAREHLATIVGHTEISISLAAGPAVETLVDEAKGPDVVMVAIGRRGLGTLPDLLLGSTARSLLHVLPKPVAFVPRRPGSGWLEDGTVVAGVDGSEMSGEVIRFVARLGAGNDVVVAQCVDVGAEMSVVLLEEAIERTTSDIRQRWCEPLSGISFKIVVRHAEPRSGLVAVADEEGAACVVVGLHGAGAYRGIGGTTSYLARHLEAPLVVVPPA